MPADELLLAFYSGEARDAQGRTHAEILSWSDAALEAVHDYIQWLFPLPEPSAFNRTAPLLTPRVLAAFRESDAMRNRLRAAFLRMVRFYGLALEAEGSVGPGKTFALRAGNWLTPHNHNHFRLTRILRSLSLLGLNQESAALLAALGIIYEAEQQGAARITSETFSYWQRAAK